MGLEGEVAVIAGAARGMGKSIAELFAKESAKVVVADILEDEAKEAVEAIAKNGYEAFTTGLGASESGDWQKVINETVKRWRKIDVLVKAPA